MTSVAVSPVAGKSVLFLINQDLGGGVEYLARVIGDDLRSRGAHCETRVIYPSSACSAFQKLGHVASHAAMIAKSAPDVLITFQPTASAIAAVAGRIGGCRVRIVHQSNSPHKSQFAVRELDKVLGSVGAYTVTIANSRATISEFERLPDILSQTHDADRARHTTARICAGQGRNTRQIPAACWCASFY